MWLLARILGSNLLKCARRLCVNVVTLSQCFKMSDGITSKGSTDDLLLLTEVR